MAMARAIVFNIGKEYGQERINIIGRDDCIQQLLLFFLERRRFLPYAREGVCWQKATYKLKCWFTSQQTFIKHYRQEKTLDEITLEQAVDVIELDDLLKGLPARLKDIILKKRNQIALTGKDQRYLHRRRGYLQKSWFHLYARLNDNYRIRIS